MGFDVNEVSAGAKGGTELMREWLQARLPVELVEQCQIISSRVRELQDDKIRILWLHDLPNDPESEHLKNGGHEKFHALVFVSNWQMQQYVAYFNIPWSKCVVIENAIVPVDEEKIVKPTDKIKLIYHTTPHRGLELLVPIFVKLAEKHKNIELDVFSSFKIYGWEQRDEPYKKLFDICKEHPQINYHGTVPNDVVRDALAQAHIFAYPSIWTETSCISLMEAMSAQCVCIHPNLGALYETAGGTTMMYQWNEDTTQHANGFAHIVDTIISNMSDENYRAMTGIARSLTKVRFGWPRAIGSWTMLIESLLQKYPSVESRKDKGPMFSYVIR